MAFFWDAKLSENGKGNGDFKWWLDEEGGYEGRFEKVEEENGNVHDKVSINLYLSSERNKKKMFFD